MVTPSLPVSVDLKPLVDRIIDQGALNSCTACAGCSALELMYQQLNVSVEFSRMFLYYYSRKLLNRQGNQGVPITSMCQALKQYGVCYETTWPYDITKIDTAPTQSAVDQAINFKIINTNVMTPDILTNIKTMLSQGIPVLMAIPVHSSLRRLSGVWTTHSWNIVTSDANPINNYHAVLIIGYDDISQRLLIENSWGPGWGDGGFFGFPYGYINKSAQLATLTIDSNSVDWANKTPYVAPKPPRNYNPYYFIGVIVLSIVLVIGSGFIK